MSSKKNRTAAPATVIAPGVTVGTPIEQAPDSVLGAAAEDTLVSDVIDTGAEGTTEANAAATPTTVAPDTSVLTPAAPTTASVVEQAAPVAKPEPTTASIISAAQATASIGGKLALDQIADYIEAMRPNHPIAPEDGARYQFILYRSLTAIINNLDEDFNSVFSAVLKLFILHREGVFHQTYVFRFYENIPLSETDRKAFLRLVNLIKVMAPVKGRDLARRQVNFQNSLEFGVTDIGRQRIESYFGN